jgi:hypothetical protein
MLRDHGQDEQAELAIIEKAASMAFAATAVTMVVMMIRGALGPVEMAVKTASVSVSHEADIDLDIS